MKASIIIRALNEEENISKVFEILRTQDTQDFEVIVVDNESSDGTVKVAESNGARITTIPRNEFSMPKAINVGARMAKGEFLVMLSAHAFPVRTDWLSSGLRHFSDKDVAGVYSPCLPRKGSGWLEKLFYVPFYLKARLRGPTAIRHPDFEFLGNTNSVIRKSLWEEHPFDERYGQGGEDVEWSGWALETGHAIVCDTAFVVRHSHELKWREFLQQKTFWEGLSTPQAFDRSKLTFRNDKYFD